MTKNSDDPIIAELRAVRNTHAACFDYDISAIFRDLRKRQEKSGRKYALYSDRRLETQFIDSKSARKYHQKDLLFSSIFRIILSLLYRCTY